MGAKKAAVTQEGIVAYVVRRLRQSDCEEEVRKELHAAGLTFDETQALLKNVRNALHLTADRRRITLPRMLLALCGGLIGGLVGAVLYALFTLYTGFEPLLASWCLGLLSGGGALLVSQGRRGVAYQSVAMLCGIVSFEYARYLSFVTSLHAKVAAAPDMHGLLSLGTYRLDALGYYLTWRLDTWSPYELLWLIMVILAAAFMLRPKLDVEVEMI